jgi:photosystem II stability/assembly factor-like uncharacterized protein
MKKILPFYLCLNFFCTLQAQTISDKWTPQAIGALPQNYDIVGISVVNKDVIWAIADSTYVNPLPSTFTAKVLKSINGGTSWQVFALPIAARIGLDIHAVDANVAWVATQLPNSGTAGHNLFKTTDGGANWVSKLDGYGASLFVRFFDAQNGIAWNRAEYALTQNGGDTWARNFMSGWSNTEGFLLGGITNACAIIGDTIMAGTSTSRIVMSPDKGVTWKFQDLRPVSFFGQQVAILSVTFKDARNGIALGWNQNNFNSYLAKTTDGGTTWTYMTTYPFTVGSSVEYIRGTSNSYLVTDSDGLTAYTTNAGQSWVKIDSARGQTSRFIDKQTGWIGRVQSTVGGPAIYKWNGGGILSDIKVFEAEEIALKMSPNPTSRFLNVEYSADFKPTSLSIYDATGKTVLVERNLGISSQVIDLQGFTNGFYLVQLKNTEGVIAHKIVVER